MTGFEFHLSGSLKPLSIDCISLLQPRARARALYVQHSKTVFGDGVLEIWSYCSVSSANNALDCFFSASCIFFCTMLQTIRWCFKQCERTVFISVSQLSESPAHGGVVVSICICVRGGKSNVFEHPALYLCFLDCIFGAILLHILILTVLQ